MKYGKTFGGSDPELIEGDIFRIIVKYPDFEKQPESQPESRPKSRPELRPELRLESRLDSRLESKLAAKVLLLIEASEVGKAYMAKKLGHKTVSGELHKQIKRLLEYQLIEMTIPDKPTSSKQKYRITEKGKNYLKQLKGDKR